MQRVLILGAQSAIAKAFARQHAARGDHLVLVARDAQALAHAVQDFMVRGAASVQTIAQDLAQVEAHASLWQSANAQGPIDTVLLAYGVLPDQEANESSVEETLRGFWVNANSAIALLCLMAQGMKSRAGARIGVISSVAGDRGRKSNYGYGAAKAALSAYALGMGQMLHPHGVSVTVIKPGFVDTPMTAAFKKGPLWAQPERVAKEIVHAMDSRRPILYTPFFWRWIMMVIAHLPESLLRRRPI